MEEYAWVIEYLPQGRSADSKTESIVQLIGHNFFTLLEATVKSESVVSIGQKVYIGKEYRNEIARIKGRLNFFQLTQNAKENASIAIRSIVQERESDFIAFINKAAPISMRIHQLEFLPGIGKKYLESLLIEREKKPFENFADLKARIPSITDPVLLFTHRILNELENKEKHHIFLASLSPHTSPPHTL
ncbi:MAG: DUF655 domain-containing protein [Candidatus Micrarchaeota archaeon]